MQKWNQIWKMEDQTGRKKHVIYVIYLSGEGNYDKQGVKIRQWTDLDEKLNRLQYPQKDNSNYKVTFTGQYRNGNRFGKWTIAHLGTNM